MSSTPETPSPGSHEAEIMAFRRTVRSLRAELKKAKAALAASPVSGDISDTQRLDWVAGICTCDDFKRIPDDIGQAREFIDAAIRAQRADREKGGK